MVRQGKGLVRLQMPSEGGMSGIAGGGFRAKPEIAANIDADDGQAHVEVAAKFAAMFGPALGIGMQAVMHVQGTQAGRSDRRLRRQPMQQDG